MSTLDKKLDDILSNKPKKDEGENPEGEDLGPCAARPMPKGWTALIVKGARDEKSVDQGWRGFQYCHMGYANFRPDGLSFIIEFNEPEKWRITVHGRKLDGIFTRLMHHKLEWINKADRDFAEDGKPIITFIKVERMKDEK